MRTLLLTAGNADLAHQHEQCDEIDRRIKIHATLLEPGRWPGKWEGAPVRRDANETTILSG
jgi:hypothetical protein